MRMERPRGVTTEAGMQPQGRRHQLREEDNQVHSRSMAEHLDDGREHEVG
jgi:hypothetical protein